MTKKEFEQRISLVKAIENQAIPYREEITAKVAKLPENINSLVSAINNRNEMFKQYLESIEKFNFVDEETVLSDVFPGLRSAYEMFDPEEALQKAEAMKEQAAVINSENQKIEAFKGTAISNVKKSLVALIEYLKQEEQIFELEIDLLRDLDSPYDIGLLGKNS